MRHGWLVSLFESEQRSARGYAEGGEKEHRPTHICPSEGGGRHAAACCRSPAAPASWTAQLLPRRPTALCDPCPGLPWPSCVRFRSARTCAEVLAGLAARPKAGRGLQARQKLQVGFQRRLQGAACSSGTLQQPPRCRRSGAAGRPETCTCNSWAHPAPAFPHSLQPNGLTCRPSSCDHPSSPHAARWRRCPRPATAWPG